MSRFSRFPPFTTLKIHGAVGKFFLVARSWETVPTALTYLPKFCTNFRKLRSRDLKPHFSRDPQTPI